MQFDFTRRDDGTVEVRLRGEWPLFNEALADSVSSLPPRGQNVLGPSTYWVDVALNGLGRALATGSEQPFTVGNITLLRVKGGMVEARYDYDDDAVAGEFMAVDDFSAVLSEWRRRIEASASGATSAFPETYRRNPHRSPTLGELLSNLGNLDPELTIFVDASPDEWTTESNAILLREEVEDDAWKAPPGWRYFLEVSIASDVAEDWATSRHRALSEDEIVGVVMHYARWDAYPAESVGN